jgi:hypothetical protein
MFVAEQDAAIDVSGAGADPMPLDHAENGVNPGDNGSPGRRGNNGKDGGNVEIIAEKFEGSLTIVSRGSDATPGQEGGKGQKGQTGAAGTDHRDPGRGHPGGDGGAGGNGGKGGNGGAVSIYSLSEAHPSISFDNSPGQGETGGEGGWFGDGGEGGRGGATYGRRDLFGRRSRFGRRPGARGRDGYVGLKGKKGELGNRSATTIHGCTKAQVASAASSRQLSMVMHSAELDYVNGNTNDAAIKLDWLLKMTTKDSMPMEHVVPVPPVVAQHSRLVKEKNLLHERALMLIQQLSSGLDYYGHAYNYVELVDRKYYETYLDAIFLIGSAIEKRQEEFWNANYTAKQRQAALKLASSELKQARQYHEAQLVTLGKSSDAIQAHIDRLTTQLVNLRQSIQSAGQAFRNAVEDRSGCSLNDVLNAVEIMVAVAASVYTAGTSTITVIGAYATAAKATPEMIKTFDKQQLAKYKEDKNFVNVLREVGKDISTIRDGYAKLKDALQGPKDNSAKLVIDESDYDTVLQPYMAMPEAQRLKALLDSYLSVARARNSASLEYTAVILQRDKLLNLMEQDQINLDRISLAVAETINPELYACAAYLDLALERLKVVVVRTITMSKRAVEFANLTELSVPLRDKTLAELAAALLKLRTDEVSLLEVQNGAAQKFVDYQIRIDDQELIASFRDSKKIAINLALDTPPFSPTMANVRVSTVRATLEGIKTETGWVGMNVSHNGISRFRTAAKTKVEFAHRPRVNLWKYNYNTSSEATSAEFGGSAGTFVDVSPFGLWSLIVLPSDSPGVDLSKVTAVVLKFSGTFHSIP